MSLRPTRVLWILTMLLAFLVGRAHAQVVTELPVERVVQCPNSQFECPEWRPYVRLGDLPGQIYFLISLSNMGCEVDMMVAAKLQDKGRGILWLCAWRSPR